MTECSSCGERLRRHEQTSGLCDECERVDDWRRILGPGRDVPDDRERWQREKELEEELLRTGTDPFARIWRDEPPQDQLRVSR